MQISSVWGYSIYQVKNKTALTNTVIKWPRIIDQQLAVYHRTYAKILVDKRNLILYFHFSLKAHCLLDFKQIITLNLTIQVIYVYRYLIHVQYDFSCWSSAFWHSITFQIVLHSLHQCLEILVAFEYITTILWIGNHNWSIEGHDCSLMTWYELAICHNSTQYARYR